MFPANTLPQCQSFFTEVRRISAQRPHRPPGQRPRLADNFLAHRVNGVPAKFHHMEAVEAEACLREVFARPGDERLGHIHGDLPNPRRIDVPLFELGNERVKRRLVLARREEK